MINELETSHSRTEGPVAELCASKIQKADIYSPWLEAPVSCSRGFIFFVTVCIREWQRNHHGHTPPRALPSFHLSKPDAGLESGCTQVS